MEHVLIVRYQALAELMFSGRTGPRGLGHSLSASYLHAGSMTIVQFKDPYRSLTPRSHVTLTGYSEAKGTSLHICFTALVRVC